MNPSGTFNYCKLCEVSVSGNLEAHNQGRKHVRCSQIMAQRHTEAERTIFVCGFSTSTNIQNLTTHFNKYGNVTKVHMQKTKALYAFVEFATAAEAKATLQPSASHIVDRRLLVVKPKAVERPTTYIPDPPINTTPSINHDQLMNQLRAAESVLAQMTLLYELLRLSRKDLEVRKNIAERLEAEFVMRIPECHVRQFGSSVNGCGMRGSDMDLFLDLNLETDCAASSSHGSTTSPTSGASTPSPPNRPNTPNTVLRITDTGRKLIAGLKQATVRQRINYVHKVLTGSNLRLGKLLKIPSTRCPYVQFVHAASGTDCDLSINNRLALQNTELLKAMCRIEPRFQTLIFTLRYLFKFREISGGASGGQRLTSYALCWLAITYMQQCDPPLLPSINRLMELADFR